MSFKQTQTGRRNFLKQVLRLGSGGAIFAAACSSAFAIERPADRTVSPEKTKSLGYRLTSHIKTYYETADS